MDKKIQIYIFLLLLSTLTFICLSNYSKEKIFCYFVSLITIQIVFLKYNDK